MEQKEITVQSTVKAPIEKVWNYLNSPEHITKWNTASDDWHTGTKPKWWKPSKLKEKIPWKCRRADGRRSWIISKSIQRPINSEFLKNLSASGIRYLNLTKSFQTL